VKQAPDGTGRVQNIVKCTAHAASSVYTYQWMGDRCLLSVVYTVDNFGFEEEGAVVGGTGESINHAGR
jgi:hypothetical protein